MKFKTDTTEHNNQIEMADKVNKHPGMMAVVTVAKSSSMARKCYYGFHFEVVGAVEVGEIQKLDDGTIRRVEAVLH